MATQQEHGGTRVERQIDAIQIVLDDLDEKVERLDEAIRGNGTTGLTTRMALLDRRVESCEAFLLEFRSFRRWLAMGILALFGSLAWRVLEWYISSHA